TNLSPQDGVPSTDQRVVMVDSQDRVWAGSWGGGITIFEESDQGFTLSIIDETDGTLAGITIDPSFVLVTDLTEDEFGNIWIVNREAANDQVLPVRIQDGNFLYFLSTLGEIGTRFVNFIEIDRFNRIWLATEDRGIKVIDYMETLQDKSDDNFAQGLTVANDNLLDNKITALAEDKDGVMWIGTEKGLNFWQGQVGRQTRLINDVINVVGIDPINNKWIGTPKGISVLEKDGRSQMDFTTGNSPLVSNNIQSFAFNEETGEVWIGTTNGLSRLQTPFTAPKEDLTQLTGFPNPFLIDGFEDVFTIANLAEDTSVNIYTSSGNRVRTFTLADIQGAQVTWDGKDDDGNLVASGIYVYLAFTDNDLAATGKVAVIRR
ncbi:MAG: two-component regulator propeller domain-containing protein, partial [bacterium]